MQDPRYYVRDCMTRHHVRTYVFYLYAPTTTFPVHMRSLIVSLI